MTKEDLIGKIADFPIEVVEKMLDRQEEQGNPRDVRVFQKKGVADTTNKGFEWDDTPEGSDFWGDVTNDEDFRLFCNILES